MRSEGKQSAHARRRQAAGNAGRGLPRRLAAAGLRDTTIVDPDQSVMGLAFNPDGSRLVAARSDDARLWDLRLIRAQLAVMHLDWDLPAYPPPKPIHKRCVEPTADAAIAPDGSPGVSPASRDRTMSRPALVSSPRLNRIWPRRARFFGALHRCPGIFSVTTFARAAIRGVDTTYAPGP